MKNNKIPDSAWVDPPEEKPIKCEDCANWEPCPYCGEHGWCTEFEEFTAKKDDCDY